MMKIFIISLFFLVVSSMLYGQEKKIIYKYKKYEKFDFDELSVEGEGGSPGDLSITPRFQKQFKNKLPSKPTFSTEIRKSIERVR